MEGIAPRPSPLIYDPASVRALLAQAQRAPRK
jgi:hypothetical protein